MKLQQYSRAVVPTEFVVHVRKVLICRVDEVQPIGIRHLHLPAVHLQTCNAYESKYAQAKYWTNFRHS